MAKRWWVLPLVALGGVLLSQKLRPGVLERLTANVRAFDLPSAGLYDAVVTPVMDGLYRRAAREVAVAFPAGAVLEVGSGPGQLAVYLARQAPRTRVVGLDLSPDMVERARRKAADAGLAARVQFEVGDVAALPFLDGTYDGVVSTFSLHHWQDAARGLAEIHRVLKPGGEAWIYDFSDWLRQWAHEGTELARLAAASPFRGGSVEVVRWPGPVPLVRRLRLRRSEQGGP
ncbi:MAG: class I SAM-dependent methyltransferase [Chloroflexi bacterium]|nr:class I SAM-dependent methyltransferase [Chloroflexota bacterium]